MAAPQTCPQTAFGVEEFFKHENRRHLKGSNHLHRVKLHTLMGPASAMIFLEDLNYGYFVFVLLITRPFK